MAERMNALFDDVQQDRATQKIVKHKPRFLEKNKKDLMAASAALALTSAGKVSTALTPLSPLSLPLVIYAGRDVHRKTFALLKQGRISISTLMTLMFIGAILRVIFLLPV